MGRALRLRLRDDEIASGAEDEARPSAGEVGMSWIRALASEWEAAREPLFERRLSLAVLRHDPGLSARS